MKFIKFIKQILKDIRENVPTPKEFNYFDRTGKVPLCGCDDFLETNDCAHIRKVIRSLNKKIK
jgi:hypothetical protein